MASNCYPNLILLKDRKSIQEWKRKNLFCYRKYLVAVLKIAKTAAKKTEVLNNHTSRGQNGGSSRNFVNLMTISVVERKRYLDWTNSGSHFWSLFWQLRPCSSASYSLYFMLIDLRTHARTIPEAHCQHYCGISYKVQQRKQFKCCKILRLI